jgi:hypothetical protein
MWSGGALHDGFGFLKVTCCLGYIIWFITSPNRGEFLSVPLFIFATAFSKDCKAGWNCLNMFCRTPI